MIDALRAPVAWVGYRATTTAIAFGRFGSFFTQVLRSVSDAGTWSRLLILQMSRLGV